jgi:hypothetical protein
MPRVNSSRKFFDGFRTLLREVSMNQIRHGHIRLLVIERPGFHQQPSDAVLHPRRLSHHQIAVAQDSPAMADEPTGNLDCQSGLEIMSILQKLNSEGRTVVLITHDQNIAEHAGRILVLREGRIFEDSKREAPLNAEKELFALTGGAQ